LKLIKVKHLYLAFLLLSGATLVAQPAQQAVEQSVFAIDAETNRPIEGAVVSFQSGQAIADENGVVILSAELPVEVLLSHVSYISTKVIIRKSGQTVYLQPLEKMLQAVEVTGFDFERELIDQAAPIAYLQPADLAKFNETSLVPSLNTLPGVRMEERAPSSYRVSIRGSSIRSPFGVRNVKVYWNDLPFTEANGTTPLNILDLSNTERIEVLKGPSGSVYGAGTGGTLLLSSANPRDIKGNGLTWQSMAGSYGLWKHQFSGTARRDKSLIEVKGVSLKSDGYREQSFTDRKVAQVSAHLFPSANHTVSVHSFFSDLNYGIPGGLTLDQLNEDRRQARPGSVDRNASIDQKSVYVGVVNDIVISDNFENKTSLLYSYVDFQNPFNLDYKREFNSGLGGRTKFVWHKSAGEAQAHLSFGGEWQQGWSNAYNFGNVMGKADTLRFHDDLLIKQYFAFAQLDVDLPGEWVVTGGLSRNYQVFDIDRDQSKVGPAFTYSNSFDPIWVPRLAVLKKLSDRQSIYASLSNGFSPPTIDEVRTNEGSINKNLTAEKGTNYELGYRASIIADRWFVDATAFYFKLKGTIVTRTNQDGVVLFDNAGNTNQKGIELKVNGVLSENPTAFIASSKLQVAYTGYHFRFEDYQKGDDDFSGNKLTGVAPNTIATVLDIAFKGNFYSNLSWFWSDKIPLRDDNTVYADAYSNVTCRLGWKNQLASGKWGLELFAGVDNLLDQKFSWGNDLNAFGGRNYQPAPARNYYGGLKIRL
jgi:iron complex outermembrane recepter protein